jgi:hypothetical protein
VGSFAAINALAGSGPPPAPILWLDQSAMVAMAGAPQATFNTATGDYQQSMRGDLLYAPKETPPAVGNESSTPQDLLDAPSPASPENTFSAVPGVPTQSQDIIYGAGPGSAPQGIVFGSDPAMLLNR